MLSQAGRGYLISTVAAEMGAAISSEPWSSYYQVAMFRRSFFPNASAVLMPHQLGE